MTTDIGPSVQSLFTSGSRGGSASTSSSLTVAHQLKFLRAAFARVRSNTGRGAILFIGDSTTLGSGAGGTPGYTVLGRPSNRICDMQKLMQSYSIPAQADSTIGEGNITTGALTTWDTRWVTGSGWVTNTLNSALGTAIFQNTTTTNNLSFTPSSAVDTFTVYYAISPSQGTFNVNLDGGTNTLLTATGGSAAVGTQVLTAGSAGTHTLNIARATGSAIILGVRCYNSTLKNVELIQAAGSGALSSTYTSSTSNPWDAVNMIPRIAPDVTVLSLGINDWANSISVATYTTNMQTLITAALSIGDCVLVTPPPTQASSVALSVQQNYVTALQTLATTNNILLVDIWSRFISHEEMVTYGEAYASTTNDLYHPTGVGYFDWAVHEWAALNSSN